MRVQVPLTLPNANTSARRNAYSMAEDGTTFVYPAEGSCLVPDLTDGGISGSGKEALPNTTRIGQPDLNCLDSQERQIHFLERWARKQIQLRPDAIVDVPAGLLLAILDRSVSTMDSAVGYEPTNSGSSPEPTSTPVCPICFARNPQYYTK